MYIHKHCLIHRHASIYLPGTVVSTIISSLPGPTPASVTAKTVTMYFDDCSKGPNVTWVSLIPEMVTSGLGVVMLMLD